MTKLCHIAFIGVLLAGLVGCPNTKKDQEGKEPLNPPPVAAPSPGAGAAPPAAAPAASAPAGSAAGSSAGPATPTPVGCATASPLVCGAGEADGCTGGVTSVHVCVAAQSKPGEPCAHGAAITCPTGQIDACSYSPPYASNHVCVVVPRPTP